MGALEEFKAEIDKFIQFMNERLKLHHLDTDEEYDAVIDNLVVEYYRSGNEVLVFDDMEMYEYFLGDNNYRNEYEMFHGYKDDRGQPRDRACPREHTDVIKSADGRYEAIITTIAIMETPYLYKKLIAITGLFIPQFFLDRISDSKTYKDHYKADFNSAEFS